MTSKYKPIIIKTDLSASEIKKATEAARDITEGSGNVFADLGRPNAEELQERALLTSQLYDYIQYNDWKHEDVTDFLGIERKEARRIIRGRLSTLPIEKLRKICESLTEPRDVDTSEILQKLLLLIDNIAAKCPAPRTKSWYYVGRLLDLARHLDIWCCINIHSDYSFVWKVEFIRPALDGSAERWQIKNGRTARRDTPCQTPSKVLTESEHGIRYRATNEVLLLAVCDALKQAIQGELE